MEGKSMIQKEVTYEVKLAAIRFLGRNITSSELNLYLYLDHEVKNSCSGWSYSKLTLEDIRVLNDLEKSGHVIYCPDRIILSRPFYDFIQSILALSYVEEFL